MLKTFFKNDSHVYIQNKKISDESGTVSVLQVSSLSGLTSDQLDSVALGLYSFPEAGLTNYYKPSCSKQQKCNSFIVLEPEVQHQFRWAEFKVWAEKRSLWRL